MGKSVKRQRAKKRKSDHSGSSATAAAAAKHQPRKNGPAAAITTKNRGKVASSIIQLLDKQRSPVLSSYLSEHSNVLIVGDGDFSFGRALVQLRRQYRHENASPPVRRQLGSLIVTGYDSRTEALRKYGGVDGGGGIEKSLHLIEKEPGATVLHSIDATKSLQEQLQIEGQKSTADATAVAACNIVVFNFPHSGQQRVHINRNLLYDFFQSVRTLFLAQQQQPPQPPRMRTGQKPPRQVHVTMKNQRPYIHWGLDDSAKAAGFVPAEEKKNKVHFDMKLWNAYGYRHQTTLGPQEATSLPQLLPNEAKLAQTWIFNFIEPEEDQYQPPAEDDDDDDDANNEYQRPQLQNHPAMTTINDAQRRNKETKSPLPAPPLPPPPQCKRTEKDEERHQSMTDNDPGSKRTDDDTVTTTVVVVVTDEMIDDLVQKRDQARRDQNWPEADRLRTLLISHYGVTLRDHSKQQNTNGASSSWSWTKKKVPNKAKS
jgi:Domain of unknown function (DUF2431)